MRILFLSGWYPYPPSNGSKLRIYSLLRGVAKRHEVTLLSFADRSMVDADVSELSCMCQNVQVVPRKSFEPRSRRARLGFLSLAPRSVIDTFSPEMAQRIEHTLDARDYDLVIASEWMTAGYGRYFRGLPALFDDLEVGLLYERFAHATSVWHRCRYGLTWVKHKRYLARLLRYFRACTVVSEQEQQLLARIAPGYQTVDMIPNCVNLADYRDVHEVAQPNTLIFTGPFAYSPNYEAMLWFLGKVYRHVQVQVPEVHLTITGDHAGQPLPPASNVTLTGFVDDVRPRIASSWVVLAPIRQGGGTRLKILEAMALRVPVVSTSKGAEGLEVQHNKHLLIADTPEAFAEAVIRLLRNASLRQDLVTQGYQLIRQKYDWAAVAPRFLNLIEQIAHR
jgi:glycosyltransferase involved in cell wall biosynthesis